MQRSVTGSRQPYRTGAGGPGWRLIFLRTSLQWPASRLRALKTWEQSTSRKTDGVPVARGARECANFRFDVRARYAADFDHARFASACQACSRASCCSRVACDCCLSRKAPRAREPLTVALAPCRAEVPAGPHHRARLSPPPRPRRLAFRADGRCRASADRSAQRRSLSVAL